MIKNKKILFALSVLFAAALWFYVVTVVTPEDSTWIYNIPVSYENEDGIFSDRDLVLGEGSTSNVNLKFYGRRSDLMKLSRSNITVTVDLSAVDGAGTWELPYEYRLPDNVRASAISLVARSTSVVQLMVEKLAVKSIEVRARFEGEVAPGYLADPIEAQYDTLEISGPEDLVAQVDYASVVLERTNLSKTVTESLPYTLCDSEGNPVAADEIRCDVSHIDVVMPISMVKEVPLTVTLSPGGGATAEHAVVDIMPQTISLKGDAEQLEALNSINLGTIDLGSIQTDYTKTFAIVPPDNLQNLSDLEAEVSVQLVNLKETTLRVTNIEVINAPQDVAVVLGSSTLQVKLRGDATVIDSITASDVRAVVDLNLIGTTVGQYNIPVSIYVDAYSDVGAMGTYSILVTISETVSSEESAVAISGTAGNSGNTGNAGNAGTTNSGTDTTGAVTGQ